MPHRCTVLLLGSVTAFQSMWIFMCHCFVQMYLQFPMDSLFQLMWEGKPPPRMFKSTSIIHVLKSHKERLPFSPHTVRVAILSHYMSMYHRRVSQRADVDLERLMYKWFSFYQWTTSRKSISTKSRPLSSFWGSREIFCSSHLDLIKQSRLPWKSQLTVLARYNIHWRWVHLKPSSFILLKKIGL